MLKNQIRIPHLVHHFKNINLSWIPYRPLFLRTRENSSSSWHQSSKNKPADKIWLRTLSLHSIRPNLWSSISFIRSPPIIEIVWKRSFISTIRQLHFLGYWELWFTRCPLHFRTNEVFLVIIVFIPWIKKFVYWWILGVL